MDNILETLTAFVKNHSTWSPENFQDIQNETIRKVVRAAFREPSKWAETLVERGKTEELHNFSLRVKEVCPFMYYAVFACILDMLYNYESNNQQFSKELVGWFRDQDWKFPKFTFELVMDSDVLAPKKIDKTQ